MNRYPVATNELAEGLATSSAALVAANNSIEEQVALLAAGNATMQDVSAVASGLKIVAARLRGTTSEADDDAESAVTNVSKLQEKIKSLTAEANGGEGIDIINEDGSYKSTWEILTAISEIFEKMDDMSQAGLLELIAGKNRSSVVAAILQNGDILKNAYSDAHDSKGSAQKELDTYLDSIQGKVDKFTNEVQTMWMNLISSEFIKTIVDLGTWIVDLVDKIGLIPTALAGVFTYFKLAKDISPIGIFKEINESITGYVSHIQQLNAISKSGFNVQSIAAYAQAVSGLTAKQQALALAGAGLNKQQIEEILLKNKVKQATIDQIMAEGQLASVKQGVTNATIGETIVLSAEEKAKMSETAQNWLASNSSKQLTLDLLQEAVSHEAITKETAEEIAVKNGLIATNQGVKKSMWSTIPTLGKIGIIIGVITTAITAAKFIIEAIDKPTEKLIEKWEEAKTKVEDINSELKTTEARIKELESKGALSITDKQELIQLKQTNDELERRLRLEKAVAEEAGNAAKAGIRKDYKEYTMSLTVGDISEDTLKKYNDSEIISRLLPTLQDNLSSLPALNNFDNFTEYQQGVIKSALSAEAFIELSTKPWVDVSDTIKEEVYSVVAVHQKAMEDISYASVNSSGFVHVDTYIDEMTKKIQEYKDDLYDINGQLKPGLSDEYVKETTDAIDAIESELASVSMNLYDYMDDYDGDANDEFVKNLQAQIDKIDRIINPVEFYGNKFDEVLGKYSDDKKKLYELAEAGTLSADVLNGVTYEPLMRELRSLGVTAQDVVDHIMSLSETEIAKVTDPTFNIADYADNIDSIQDNISTLQSTLESLESGTFTYSDFIDLTQQFPELAEGVDTSSKSFSGLAKNLRKAIKASPDELVDELKDLRKQLQASGKSTSAIDQLITSMENLPIEAVKNLSNEYVTLADEINAAKKAQNELQEAMSENPNEGYETRGEAMEYMKDKMKRGEIGSESELWDVAEQYGFTYDSAKTINENADALANFIAIREKWFAQNDDGEYTFEGTEDFIQSVENALTQSGVGSRLDQILDWNYDETTGAFNFDFNNENWDEIVELLSKTEELAGLTSEEFHDMMVQIGQYFGLNWEDADDVKTHLDTIASSAADAKAKVEEYGEVMQAGLGKDTKIDLTNRPRLDVGDGSYETVDSRAYSNEAGTVTITVTPILPDGTKLTDEELEKYTNDIIDGADPETYEFEVQGKTYTGDDIILAKHYGEDSIDQANKYGKALHEAQEEYYALVDEMKSNPLSIKTDGDIETDIINPLKAAGLKVDEVIDEAGNKQFTFDVVDLETLMRDNGYTTENIMEVVNRIFGEGSNQSQLVSLREDIQNIGYLSDQACSLLEELGIEYNLISSSQGAKLYIDSNIEERLRELQFTDQEIEELKTKWETNGIYINTKANIDGAEEAKEAVDEQPESVTTTFNAETDQFNKDIKEAISNVNELAKSRTATVTLNTVTRETVVKEEVKNNSSSGPSGSKQRYMARAIQVNGTAHAHGSWGVPQDETALVGELGPELIVDPKTSSWHTVGDRGAEFTQVKRGQIVFNHKQTEQLLKNGYVTGRGKLHGSNSAFASGTAFVDGGSIFGRYEFDGDGNWKEYDVNDNVVDSYKDLSNAASDLSDAADDISDASDEFRETFDWIEVRLEEINEALSLKSAKLENAIGASEQNAIIDDMMALNQKLYENLVAGANKYYAHAAKLLEKVPDAYKTAAQDGTIAIEEFVGEVDEKTLEAIQEYREWVQKGADATQQAEEVITEIRSLAKQQFDNVAQEYDNEISLHDSKIDQFDAHNSLIETDKGFASEEIYDAIIGENEAKIKLLEAQREALQAELADIEVGTQDWYDAVNAIAAVDTEIINLKTDIEDTQDSINELHWEKFDLLMTQFDAVSNEAENLLDILGTKDAVDEFGNWTDEGVTSIGLLAQQMEVAEMQAEKYKEEIEYLNENWEELGYTQEEYINKLEELKSGQYDAIKSYNDAKNAIVDLNKERVEAIKTIIEDEIKAYEELIDAKKEELSAEQD